MQTHPALRACIAPHKPASLKELTVSPTSAMQAQGENGLEQSLPSKDRIPRRCTTVRPWASSTCMYSVKPKQKCAPMPKVAIACAHSRAARCNTQPVTAHSGNEYAANYYNMS